MAAYLLFAAGFIAGKVIGPRDIPLAATCLGAALVFAGLQLAGVKP